MPKSSKKKIEEDQQKILHELKKNSNVSINEIAEKLGWSRAKAWRIIKNLEKNHTIWGYTTITDDEKQGLKKFILLIKRTEQPIDNQLAEKMISRSADVQAKAIGCNIISSIYTHGAYDWIIIFTCKNLKDAKKAMERIRMRLPKNIKEILLLETLFPLKIQNIINPNIENLKEAF